MPDATFEAGERAAKRMRISRSELYSRALREYIAEHRAEGVTETLDQIYAEESGRLDDSLATMQLLTLRSNIDW